MIDTHIITLLDSSNPTDKKRAIHALARTRDADALRFLSAIFRAETDPEIRALAVKAGSYIRKTNQADNIVPEHVNGLVDYPALFAEDDNPPVSVEPDTTDPTLTEPEPARLDIGARRNLKSRVIIAIQMVLVLALSVLLVAYVGYGEASRTYPSLEMDKLASQAEIVNNSLRPLLLAGLTLDQIPGFNPLTQPILDSEAAIFAIYVTNSDGDIVFANTRSNEPLLLASINDGFVPSQLDATSQRYTITINDHFLRSSLELDRRFADQPNGRLHILLPRAIVNNTVMSRFAVIPAAGVLLLVIYFAYVIIKTAVIEHDDSRWLSLSYGLIFIAMAVLVNVALVNLYTLSIQGKTQALADSLTQRLDSPLALGIRLDEFNDLDHVFAEYLNSNPSLSYIALSTNNEIILHTNPDLIGQQWADPPGQFAVSQPLTHAADDTSQTTLHIGTPSSYLLSKLWRSVKNFAVLFIASGFLSLLFFRLMRSFTAHMEVVQNEDSQREFSLGLISPFYFMSVLAESLAASFLPQYLRSMATANGVDDSLVSTIFTVYFLSFVLALIPAGTYAERRGPKNLMLLGSLLISVSMLLMTVVTSIYPMFAIRALAGFGQGMLFIGVQSYILQMASGKQKTRGAAIIVFGYQGGTISGAALGALLSVYMGMHGVFFIGAITGIFSLWYALRLIPRTGKVRPETDALTSDSSPQPGFIHQLRNAFRDFEFLKTMLFIGIPTKAILTGVTVFALPGLLANLNYAQEDIGQIIMLYAAGVLISSSYIARLVDRIGKTHMILFIGTVGGGIGLILMGLAGWEPIVAHSVGALQPAFLIAGMFTLGLAHGFIHAPIITHISGTKAAESLGKSSATSLYRLLERFGHVTGPVIVGQMLIYGGDTLFTMSWLGLGIVVFGLLFLIRTTTNRLNSQQPVTAS